MTSPLVDYGAWVGEDALGRVNVLWRPKHHHGVRRHRLAGVAFLVIQHQVDVVAVLESRRVRYRAGKVPSAISQVLSDPGAERSHDRRPANGSTLLQVMRQGMRDWNAGKMPTL